MASVTVWRWETDEEVEARLGYNLNDCKHLFCTGGVCMQFDNLVVYREWYEILKEIFRRWTARVYKFLQNFWRRMWTA